jgi:hypothetical protein
MRMPGNSRRLGIYLSAIDGGAAIREQFPGGQYQDRIRCALERKSKTAKAYSHQMIDAVVADGRKSATLLACTGYSPGLPIRLADVTSPDGDGSGTMLP